MECQQTVEDAGFYTHYNTFTFFHTSCICCNSHRKVTSMCFHTNAHRSLHHSHVRNDHHFNRRKQQKAAGAHEVYCITSSPMLNKKKQTNLWTSFCLHEPWEEDFYQENVEYKKIWPQQSHIGNHALLLIIVVYQLSSTLMLLSLVTVTLHTFYSAGIYCGPKKVYRWYKWKSNSYFSLNSVKSSHSFSSVVFYSAHHILMLKTFCVTDCCAYPSWVTHTKTFS